MAVNKQCLTTETDEDHGLVKRLKERQRGREMRMKGFAFPTRDSFSIKAKRRIHVHSSRGLQNALCSIMAENLGGPLASKGCWEQSHFGPKISSHRQGVYLCTVYQKTRNPPSQQQKVDVLVQVDRVYLCSLKCADATSSQMSHRISHSRTVGVTRSLQSLHSSSFPSRGSERAIEGAAVFSGARYGNNGDVPRGDSRGQEHAQTQEQDILPLEQATLRIWRCTIVQVQRGTASLYFVYLAMEEEIEKNKDHPQLAPIYFPAELHRCEALARDLEYFYGADWQSQISLSPGTEPYVDRIHQVGARDPVLLVAHSYTRYMGDLSGGQIPKKVAQRALKLPSTGQGVHFYQFEGIHSHGGFKQLYRSRMNEIELDVDAKRKIVAESNGAFRFNLMVFTELEDIGKSIPEEAQQAAFGHGHAEIMQGGDINKCPYYAAKMAVSGNPTYACQLAKSLLQHSRCQLALATWIALLAGFTAWYLL
ncbi:heme oxygenase 2a [Vanacampus margaritifer]